MFDNSLLHPFMTTFKFKIPFKDVDRVEGGSKGMIYRFTLLLSNILNHGQSYAQ